MCHITNFSPSPNYCVRVIRSRRLLAGAAVLVSIAAWAAAPPAIAAQADTVVIELEFVTTGGEPPAGEVAVLDVNTGIEYRNDRVSQGGSIEVDAAAGAASELLIRRTDLSPSAVSCEGQGASSTVRGSRVIVTPGQEGAVCIVTLSSELPVTGASPLSPLLVVIGLILLGVGGLVVGGSRATTGPRVWGDQGWP